MKWNILSLLCALIPNYLIGQQTVQYTQFPMMTYAYNPAYAGMDGVVSLTGLYRGQWSGISDNLIHRHVHAHSPYYQWNGGIGLQIGNLESGAHVHNSIKASYNYVYILPSNVILSAGVAVGILQRNLDGRKIRTPGGNYEGGQIIHDDPALPNSLETGYAPDIDFGLFAAYGRLEVGISIQQMLNNQITLQGEYRGGFTLRRTFNLHAEYEFWEYEDFIFTSAVLLRTDLSVIQTDILAKVQYGQNMTAGISLRGYNSKSVDALTLFGDFRLSPNFVIGYGYDITLSALNQVGRGSHEIIVKYTLDRPLGVAKKEKIIYSPRL